MLYKSRGEYSSLAANDTLDLHRYVVPRHAWVLEVDGDEFHSLHDAEAMSRRLGKPIYCRVLRKKAANQ